MVNASRDHDAAVIRLEEEWRQQRLLGEEEDADRHRSKEEEACAEGSRQAVVGQRKTLRRVLRRAATRRLGAFWAIWWRHCAHTTRRQEMLAYIIRSGLVRSWRRYLWRWRDRCRDHAVTVRQQRCDELHAHVHSANRRTITSRLGHTLVIIASRSVHTAWVAWMRFVLFHRRREVVVGKLGRRFHHVGLRDAFRTLCRATAAVAVQESQMQLDDMQRYRDVLAVQVREGKAKHAEVETWLRGEMEGLEQRLVNTSREHDGVVSQLHNDHATKLNESVESTAARQDAAAAEVAAIHEREAKAVHRRLMIRLVRRVHVRGVRDGWMRWTLFCDTVVAQQDGLQFIIARRDRRQKLGGFRRWLGVILKAEVLLARAEAAATQDEFCLVKEQVAGGQLGRVVLTWTRRSKHLAWVSWTTFVMFQRRRDAVVMRLGKRMHHFGVRDAFRTLCRATAAVAVQESQMQLDDMQRYRDVLAVQVRESNARHAELEGWLQDETSTCEQRLVNASREHDLTVSRLQGEAEDELNHSLSVNRTREETVMGVVEVLQAKLQSLLASARRAALGAIGRQTWQRQVYCAWEQWARLFREARRMAWALRAMLRVRRNQVLSSTSQALGRWRAAWEDDVQKERWWNATTVSSLPWLRRFKNGARARGGSFPPTSPHSSSLSSPTPHVAVSGLRLRQDLHNRQVENKIQRIRRMVRLIAASHYRSAVRAWRMALARHKVVAKVWGRTRLRRTSNWFHRWVAQTRKEAMGILDVELDTKLLLATQEVDGFKEQMGEWDRLLRGHRFVDKADFLLKRSLRSALHTWRGRSAHIGAAKTAAGMVLRRMGRARVLAALMQWRIVQFHDTRSLRIDFTHLTGSHHETT